MKKQTLAACVCAAIALGMFSCDWLGKDAKKQAPQVSSLIGKWQVTGISDSTMHAKKFGSFWFADFKPDSTKIFATFHADSILTMYTDKEPADTTKYYIDSAAQKVYLHNKTHVDSFTIVMLNDSLLRLVKDSVYFNLKKQP